MKTVSPLPSATTSSAHIDDAADAEPLHQRGGERRGQAVERHVDRDRGARSSTPTSRTPRAAGRSARPGTARKAAAPTSARKVTAATHQAGWMRCGAAAAAAVTRTAWRTSRGASEWPDGQHVQGSGHAAIDRGRTRSPSSRCPTPMAFEVGLPHAVPRRRGRRRRPPALPRARGQPRRRAGAHVGRLLAAARARRLDPARRRDTVVVPGVYGTSAMTDGTLPDELAELLAAPPAAPGWSRSAPGRSCWPPPACSTAGRPPRTGCTRRLRAAVPAGRASTPTCCSSTTATCSPRPATPPASTCCCTSSAATTAARWPTGSPAAASSPPWRDGGQSQFIERPVPEPGDAGTAATRAWALERLDRAAHAGRPGRARPDERAHLHPPLPRGDRAVGPPLARAAARRAGPPAAGDHRHAGRAGRRRRRASARRPRCASTCTPRSGWPR